MSATTCMYSEIVSLTKNRQPDFSNIEKILNRKAPSRYTLFEFFHNDRLYKNINNATGNSFSGDTDFRGVDVRINAFRAMGYDYATLGGSSFNFPKSHREGKESVSMNHGGLIIDKETFEKYQWPEPGSFDYSGLDRAAEILPEGMKAIVCGPGGVLENCIGLAGYEDLCFMIADEPELAKELFDHVGSRLLEHYKTALQYDSVGAIISNDDWGFKTQTMLSTTQMREYVFPWHKKIVAAAHEAGKYAVLHSCGYMKDIWEDVIEDIKFDGKHSYEDAIMPVEESYDLVKGRIAVLGGIDLDFICRFSTEDIYSRSKKMLEKGQEGGYGLGTGNSVPEYTPDENFFAMIKAALDMS